MKLQIELNIHRLPQMGQALIKYVACRGREESVFFGSYMLQEEKERAYTEHA